MKAGDIYLLKAADVQDPSTFLLIENHHTPNGQPFFMLVRLGRRYDGGPGIGIIESHLKVETSLSPHVQRWLSQEEMTETLKDTFTVIREAKPNPFNFNMTGEDARSVLSLMLEKHPDLVQLGNMYNRCAEINQVQPPPMEEPS